MTGETWGIPGPTFLGTYAILVAVTVIGVLIWRRWHLAGPRESAQPNLTPTQLAFLNGERELAVYSALAALRAAGAVSVTQGRLEQSGPIPSGAPELDRAVYSAAGRRCLPGQARWDPGVTAVLDRIETDLAEQGWLLSPERRNHLRLGAVATVALLVLGLTRAVAGSSNDKPIGYLLLMMVPVALITLAFLSAPRKSVAAKRILSRSRAGATHLRPNQDPSWATYGPAGAALGVGLFGTAALWAADPAFASEAEIRREAYSGSSSGSSGDGGSGGGDSGGGSSCGGGGGCGGGGCGG
jgi:uncharacterized protein (TIGR04222 family)